MRGLRLIIYCIFLFLELKAEISAIPNKSLFKSENLKNYQNLVDMVVIGGGPAGLAAAIYGSRAKLRTLVFMGDSPGGQLMGSAYVENIPGIEKKPGYQIMDTMTNQAISFGANLIYESIVSVDFSRDPENPTKPFTLITSSGQKINALTVIIANGASARKLGVEGEQKYWGAGVSTCAVCDGAFFKDLDVAVVGGGDDAVEKAMQLAPYAKTITVIVRKKHMRAAPSLIDRLEEYTQVKIIYNQKIVEILGDGQKVTALLLENTEDETKSQMPMDGLFLAVGHNPNTQIYKEYLNLSKDGYIILKQYDRSNEIDPEDLPTGNPSAQETNIPGIYAAGDVADAQFRQAACASGDAVKAALSSIGRLRKFGFNQKVAGELESNYYRHAV